MPTYEYACTSCGEHLEAVQSFSDDPLTTCPACGGPLRKVFGAVGIVLKGSGFYKNDSRSSGSKGADPGLPAKTSDTGGSKTSDTTKASDASSASSADSSSSGSSSGGTTPAPAAAKP